MIVLKISPQSVKSPESIPYSQVIRTDGGAELAYKPDLIHGLLFADP